MNRPTKLVRLNIGDEGKWTFDVETLKLSGENYIMSKVNYTQSETETVPEIYIDRSALCFPLIAIHLRGNMPRPGDIRKVAQKHELSEEDLLIKLYEDASFYALAKLMLFVEQILYTNRPQVLKEIGVSLVQIERRVYPDFEEKKAALLLALKAGVMRTDTLHQSGILGKIKDKRYLKAVDLLQNNSDASLCKLKKALDNVENICREAAQRNNARESFGVGLSLGINILEKYTGYDLQGTYHHIMNKYAASPLMQESLRKFFQGGRIPDYLGWIFMIVTMLASAIINGRKKGEIEKELKATMEAYKNLKEEDMEEYSKEEILEESSGEEIEMTQTIVKKVRRPVIPRIIRSAESSDDKEEEEPLQRAEESEESDKEQ